MPERLGKTRRQPVWLEHSRSCRSRIVLITPPDDGPKTKCWFKLLAQLNATSVPNELLEELEPARV